MMRITIDARLYGLEYKGIGRYLVNLISELQKVDKETNYTLILKDPYYEKLEVPKHWKKVRCNAREYSLAEQVVLPFVLRSTHPEIVHFPNVNVPFFSFTHRIVTVHDLTQRDHSPSSSNLFLPLYLIKLLILRLIIKTKVATSSHIITPTKVVKDELLEKLEVSKNRITVTHEGFTHLPLNLTRAQFVNKFELSNYFLFVGNSTPHKNVSFLVDVFAKYKKVKNDDVQLVLVTKKTSEITTLIDKSGCVNSIKLLENVSDSELGSLYSHSLACIFPSLKEGFGLPGLEALSADTILLASDIPVFREVYADAALYFNPRNEEELFSLLQDVTVMNSSKRKRLLAKGKKYTKQFSWKTMAERTRDVYNMVYTDVVSDN